MIIALMPHLKSEEGHDFIYHTTFEAAVREVGLDYQGYARKGTSISLPSHWKQHFGSNKALQRFCDFCQTFRMGKECLFFLESFSPKELSLFTLAAILLASKKEGLWLLLRYDLGKVSFFKKHLFLLSLRALHFKMKERLTLLTDSERIQEFFEKRLSQKVHVLPIPHTHQETVSPIASDKIRLWWPGSPRPEKGLKEIQRILTLSDHAKEGFDIWLAQGIAPTGKALPRAMPRKDYLECLTNCDVILLPYDPRTYYARTSGILVEAIVAGKMVLVKEGSYLAFELERHDLRELIVDWENPHFFTHLLSLFGNAQIRTKLARMQRSYTAFHSKESMIQILKKLLARAT